MHHVGCDALALYLVCPIGGLLICKIKEKKNKKIYYIIFIRVQRNVQEIKLFKKTVRFVAIANAIYSCSSWYVLERNAYFILIGLGFHS